MSKWVAKWEQEDYDGRYIKLTKEFDSEEEAKDYIMNMEKSAREINKHFQLISLKPVEEREVEL
ncbi:hypothetical protein [Candidatus Aciduliprofundum boonei]|uniref:Mlkl n=1 Tax=Aciduliprofundum boonei (strain DSM 19572 / T469) TaxID=439481 RepID=D3T9N8_ACIB4|nr:hypothetical protein [Candidatus Aciduliprofundum boonei]ADD08817.1 Mlkl [Aciduliprofundum boonei T469]HII55410.1 hypothetical protein [Candidatus Aciduliprofundum boonei]